MNYLSEIFKNDSNFPFEGYLQRQLSRMQRQMDRMFDKAAANFHAPSCEVHERDSHYVLNFDLPGMKKEDITIDAQNSVLTVTGERTNESQTKGKKNFQSEIFYGTFQRSFQLPPGVKAEDIEAQYNDGVLKIAIPKPNTSESKQIKVNEGKAGSFFSKNKSQPQLPRHEQNQQQQTGQKKNVDQVA